MSDDPIPGGDAEQAPPTPRVPIITGGADLNPPGPPCDVEGCDRPGTFEQHLREAQEAHARALAAMDVAVPPPLRFFLLPQVTWIPDREIRRMVDAYAIAGAGLATSWRLSPRTVTAISDVKELPDDGVLVAYSPTIETPGNLAEHWFDGRPAALVLAAPGMQLREIQVAGAHELDETDVDSDTSQFRTLPSGNRIALEVDDPTQGDETPIDLGDGGDPVWVSNYVLPAWFDASSPPGTKLDALGLISTPFYVRPGGYAVVVDAAGSVRQVGDGPAAYKRSPRHRWGRRLAAAHALALRIRLGRERP